jgi:quercetin dioxygenase-like cupin family protein
MKIIRKETQASRRGSESWFAGVVWIDEVVTSEVLKAFRVSFEPGARTAWHTHPRGQALRVEHGVCLIQLRGEPIQELTAGESVWIEPNELHWHGAAPNRTMVHLAIQTPDEHGVDVVWLDHVE